MPVLALPSDVEAVFRDFRSAELATVARDGTPVAAQLSPLWRPETGQFLLTTGIGFPYKAYNARRYPHVALLFSNPTGSGLSDPPAVLVQADALVSDLVTWDDDLAQFYPWIFARQPISTTGAMAPFYRYVIPWYWQRLKIHLTPRRIRVWPYRDMMATPQELPLPSTEPPTPNLPPPARSGPVGSTDAFARTADAVRRFGDTRLTVLGSSGYPVSTLCAVTPDAAAQGLRLDVPPWLELAAGPASLMSHRHDAQLWNLAGYLSRGVVQQMDSGWLFRPAHFALSGGGGPKEMLTMVRVTRRAAQAYLRRRGTPPPPIPWDRIAAAKRQAQRASGR